MPEAAQSTSETFTLSGAVHVLLQFDVCEEIRLDRLRDLLSAPTVQQPALKHPAPGYVRYKRPPVVEPTEPFLLDTGERLLGEIKYYDYGVVSVVLQLPFSGPWETLIALAGRWAWEIDFAAHASQIVRLRLQAAAPALIKPYADWLSEDYLIVHVRHITGSPAAADLIAAHGSRIAQVVRGDTLPLSTQECHEVLQSSISYYPTDLTVIGWNAAFLYDTPAGAEAAIQLLEYANSQLLEFRHYDELLTQVLDTVYDSFEQPSNVFTRWRRAGSANRLHTVLLEVMELTEHADNAIKFLSDMFAARLYRLAAAKVGVPDYKDLVKQKINTAEDLYRFMVDQFNQSRAFFLESAVVIILVIELIYLFRGKGL
ncbi:hypothetical protein [Edaphobacter modestus]|uniref:DUF155 domain-containing protein n=1 Tax=Edaphobacter modestus TaxID=388466 RepID=A0A4Q7YYY3_9BACT|nr:hypothetical protein [Edaphobacter modestus]RZU42704.1 hypothetical protein BDD14_4296 [Edaphobacter modestus]